MCLHPQLAQAPYKCYTPGRFRECGVLEAGRLRCCETSTTIKGGRTAVAVKPFTELLKDSPKNWECWGANDQIGAPLKVVGDAGSPVNPIVIK